MRHCVCQIPGCTNPAAWPKVEEGQLCTPCRRRVRSKVYFSPALFWGSLWVMAKHRLGRNAEESREAGVHITDFSPEWDVHVLRSTLMGAFEGEVCFATFLDRLKQLEIRVPDRDLAWLERYAREIDEKGQRRVLSTYWGMLDPLGTSKMVWLSVRGTGRKVAQVQAGVLMIEKVLKAIDWTVRNGVLIKDWSEVFPEIRRLEASQPTSPTP